MWHSVLFAIEILIFAKLNNDNEFMRRYRKSVWLPALLFVYATGLFIYSFVWGEVKLDVRSALVMGVTYLLVFAIWLLNRRRERSAENHRRDNSE